MYVMYFFPYEFWGALFYIDQPSPKRLKIFQLLLNAPDMSMVSSITADHRGGTLSCPRPEGAAVCMLL